MSPTGGGPGRECPGYQHPLSPKGPCLDRHLSAVRATLALSLFVCLAAATPARAANGLVAAYGFNQSSGTAVTDSSGTGNNGSTSGTTWNAAGRFGPALSFAGSNASVTIPDSNSLDLTSGMTLEAWVNPTAAGGPWRTVIFKQGSGMVYALYSNNGSNRPTGQVDHPWRAERGRHGGGARRIPGRTWPRPTTARPCACTSTARRSASKPQTGNIPASTGALRIGGNSVFCGRELRADRIDEVRIYSRALTAGEIQTDMAAPIGATASDTTPPTVQLTAPAAGPVSGIRQRRGHGER